MLSVDTITMSTREAGDSGLLDTEEEEAVAASIGCGSFPIAVSARLLDSRELKCTSENAGSCRSCDKGSAAVSSTFLILNPISSAADH